MRACVDSATCIGCGLCEAACPAVFAMKEDRAVVTADPVPPGEEARCREARDGCPVAAISLSEEGAEP
jgi:ferredoxin